VNLQFLIPVILLLLTSFKKNKAILFWIFVLVLSAISGLRENIGTDYKIYHDIFQGKFPVTGIDLGFMFYALSFSLVDASGQLGMLVTASITIFFHLYFIRKFSINFLFSTLLFICLPIFFLSTLNLVRAHFAISIGLMGILLFYEKKHFFSLMMIGLSCLMHIAGVVFLSVFISKFVSRKFILICIVAILVSFLLVMSTNIESIIDYYFPSFSYFKTHNSDNSPILAGLFLLINCFTLLILYIQKTFSRIQRILIILNLATIMSLLLWFVSDYSNLWLRFSNFTSVHLLISLPFALKCIKPYKNELVITSTTSIFLIFLFLGYWIEDPSFGFMQ
tara:strand:- start:2839 stop:3843 length:1005 start_codon:yes stop_codon:yes gene_type:complete